MPRPTNPKPNDQTFKSLIEADARGLLEVFGALAPNEPAIITPLEREIVLPSKSIDSGFLLEHPHEAARRRVIVLEGLSNRDPAIAHRVAWYSVDLLRQYRAPVYPYIIPLVRRACPSRPPRLVSIREGGVWLRVALEWWKPWEQDAAALLARSSPTLDVWTVLCRTSPAQEAEATRRLMGNSNLLARQRIWAGMRYRDDKEAFYAFLERTTKVITRESDRESLAVQMWLEEGHQKGAVEGRVAALREVARTILKKRFPRVSAAPLKDIQSPDELLRIHNELLDARTAAEAGRIIARRKPS